MILMANDYVGLKISEFLCSNREKIDILVYTDKGNPQYNEIIILNVRSTCQDVLVYKYEDFVDNLDEVRSMSIEYGILAWWPLILPKNLINVTKRGFVNTHPAFLPFNRGKHPYFWCMYEGTSFGVTLHYINEEIDSGRVIARKLIPYTWEDTGESLYLKAREEMINLFCETYPKIKEGSAKEIEVNWNEETFHFGNELEATCHIELDEKYKARDLLNILRGRMFKGKGAAYFLDDGKKYRISVEIESIDD